MHPPFSSLISSILVLGKKGVGGYPICKNQNSMEILRNCFSKWVSQKILHNFFPSPAIFLKQVSLQLPPSQVRSAQWNVSNLEQDLCDPFLLVFFPLFATREIKNQFVLSVLVNQFSLCFCRMRRIKDTLEAKSFY